MKKGGVPSWVSIGRGGVGDLKGVYGGGVHRRGIWREGLCSGKQGACAQNQIDSTWKGMMIFTI